MIASGRKRLDLDLVAPHLTTRRLRLILLPTEACNFRCVYCYESFRYKRMEPQVVEGVKRLLERRAAGLDTIELSWFGGEPLLARDIIEDILRHARDLVAGRPALRLSSGITTNAYTLSGDVFRTLLDLGVTSYQISFDGPREYHDRKRVLAGGKGTFDRVWANTVALRQQEGDFQVVVRVHVDRENERAIPEFIDLFQRELGGDRRFQLFVRPLSRLGGPNDGALAVFSDQESARATQTLRRYASEKVLRERPAEAHPICYAASANSFVIRANGRLNKCTVALEHPNNQVGRLLPDGTMELDEPRALPWMRGFRSGIESELACPMMGLAEPVPEAKVREDIAITPGAEAVRV